MIEAVHQNGYCFYGKRIMQTLYSIMHIVTYDQISNKNRVGIRLFLGNPMLPIVILGRTSQVLHFRKLIRKTHRNTKWELSSFMFLGNY